jgi:phosphohistidine phosphatase
MRRLILMRHAKSSWADPGQRDFDRPLNARGMRSAPLLGGWLRERGHLPDAALVSTALRARQTWDGLGLGEVPATWLDEIYEAAPATLLDLLRRAPDAATVILIGHQPGIGSAAARLLAKPVDDPAFARHPTGATTVMDFDVDGWDGIRWGGGIPVDFTVPRALG